MIPTEIRANFDFDITVEDRAAKVPAGYTPKFLLEGSTSLSKSGSVSVDDLVFSFLATDTAAFNTGQYWYQVVAENGTGGRKFIAEGTLYVRKALNGTGTFDGRTVAEQILEAIDAAMLGKATSDMQSYVIQSGSGSRSLSKLNALELKQVREYYAAIVAAEKRAENNESIFKRHKFAFVAD